MLTCLAAGHRTSADRGGPAGRAQKHTEYASWRTTVRHIVQTQGVAGLWAGLLPRGIRVVGACFILQTVRKQLIELAEGAAERAEKSVI